MIGPTHLGRSKRLKLLYISDIYTESNVYYSQVHLYVEALRKEADVNLIQFTRLRSSHDPKTGVYYLPPKMFLLFQWKLYSWLYFRDFDIACYEAIMFRGYMGAMFALALSSSNVRRQQYIYDVRADVIDELAQSKSFSGRLNKFLLGQIRSNLEAQIKLADLIFTVSAKLKDLVLREHSKGASDVRHFSTSVSKVFNPDKPLGEKYRTDFGIGEKELVFVYIGSLEHWQNVPDILKAFEAYRISGADGWLLVLTKELRPANDLIVKLCPTSRKKIICISSAPDEVHKYLQMADVGLLVRDNLALNISASPTKYGEYFNSGLHVIITNIDADYVAHGKNNPQHVTVINDKFALPAAMIAIRERPMKHSDKVNSLERIVQEQLALLHPKQ